MEDGCGVININRTCPTGNVSIYTGQAMPHEINLNQVVELYLISFLCLVGLFGNTATMVVLRKDKERREALLLLQALALADALYLLVALLRYPLKYLIPQNDYVVMQPVVFPLLKVFQTTCIWMMVLVTIDRYIYVCKPLRAQAIFNLRTRRWFAVGVFVVGFFYNAVLFVDNCVGHFYDPCTNVTISRMVPRRVFHNAWYYDVYRHGCFLILMYLVPLSILTVLNCLLIRAIKHSTRRHRGINTSPSSSPSSGEYNENNATVVLIIIVLVFIGCETPELLLRMFTLIERKAKITLLGTGLMRFTTISELLMVINSSVNFFIYLAFGRRFRRVMKETFQVRFPTSRGTVLTPESVPLHRQHPPINIARINQLLQNNVNKVKTHVSPAGHRHTNHLGHHINLANHLQPFIHGNDNQDNRFNQQPVKLLINGKDINYADEEMMGGDRNKEGSNYGDNDGSHSNYVGSDTSNNGEDDTNCNQINHG